MTHKQIRQTFLNYFIAKNHTPMPAASLVPNDDPSALFTVAGMQQFKSYYLHPNEAPARRMVTIQPCIRTVDIDEVGDDTHNTVFEMLGNFTFGYDSTISQESDGPYFKEQAIQYAWDFLTQELKIETHRMRATYFGGDSKRPKDEESKALRQFS
jgi:alanyl-tRNA synthetase